MQCSVLQRLLTYDPTERISCADALKHPWFNEVNKLNPASTALSSLAVAQGLCPEIQAEVKQQARGAVVEQSQYEGQAHSVGDLSAPDSPLPVVQSQKYMPALAEDDRSASTSRASDIAAAPAFAQVDNLAMPSSGDEVAAFATAFSGESNGTGWRSSGDIALPNSDGNG